MKGTITISGSLAQRPYIGGHTWVFLQYLLGFQRLGWDVLFVDRLEPEMCRDAEGNHSPVESSENVRYFFDVMEQFGLRHNVSLIAQGRHLGLPRTEVLERVRRSSFLLDVMGFLGDEEILQAAPRRVFLDIDPGFGQMWSALDLHDLFRGYDAYVTIGENIGKPECEIPTCGLEWITTPQPVVLNLWPVVPVPPGAGFTSVATWRGAFGPLEYQGKTYGLRVHEFRKFAALPSLSGRPFEIALDIDPGDVRDVELLESHGWSLVNPRVVARNPHAYQSFIQSSAAELMIAKTMYVETRSGWMSDRSLCYLASGRPVLAQDTGVTGIYPTTQGLLTFTTLEEALSGVAEIMRDYPRHARAAREIAAECFDSDGVLTRLLRELDAE